MAEWLDLTLVMAQSYLIVKIPDCCVPQLRCKFKQMYTYILK